jgi:hypothetical protein
MCTSIKVCLSIGLYSLVSLLPIYLIWLLFGPFQALISANIPINQLVCPIFGKRSTVLSAVAYDSEHLTRQRCAG